MRATGNSIMLLLCFCGFMLKFKFEEAWADNQI